MQEMAKELGMTAKNPIWPVNNKMLTSAKFTQIQLDETKQQNSIQG